MSNKPQEQTSWPDLHLPWYKSSLLRGALWAGLALLIGSAVSFYTQQQSIKAISRMAFDPSVEKSLDARLSELKSLQKTQQKLIQNRIENTLDLEKDLRSKTTMLSVIKRVTQDLNIDIDKVQIEKISLEILPSHKNPNIQWIKKDHLRVLNFSILFPKGAIYKAYQEAEHIKQRYQLMGVKLEENILPTFILSNSIILFTSFLILAIIFIYMIRRFRKALLTVLKGFEEWSENHFIFRFELHPKGELGLITLQFNAMANEVEAKRQRSLYLEKIASWQIIARKIAHEIKNPLTPIQMLVAQLNRRYKDNDEDYKKLLQKSQDIIYQEVASLKRMVDSFSNFARLPVPVFNETDLTITLDNVVKLQAAAFEKHHFSYKGPSQNVFLSCDEGLIKQVLINLSKNAAEACEEPANIDLTLEENAHNIIIGIIDDGPGIPEDIKTRVFEAYFTTKDTGPTPGMGLGLAISQKIILDHDGSIEVRSRPGKTEFLLSIPKTNREEL